MIPESSFAYALAIVMVGIVIWLITEARKERHWLIRAIMARHLGSLTTSEVEARTRKPTAADHAAFISAHTPEPGQPPISQEVLNEILRNELERQGAPSGYEDVDEAPEPR